MVYCGTPSKACFPCRSRRTKCDLMKPSCTQCRRTGRSCEGYRNSSSLQIRDESEAMAAKYSAQVSKPGQSNPTIRFDRQISVSKFSADCTSRSQKANSSASHIPRSLLVLPDDAAACFFFGDYVLGDCKDSHSMFDILPGLYSHATSESATSLTITALGMACMSHHLRDSEVIRRANLKYLKALQKVNSVLKCPVLSRTDETLMVVILFGLYEENNASSRSLDPWNNHLAGAMALLDLRGESQLLDPAGQQLMSGLRSQAIANALVRRISVPEKIIEWSRLARSHGNSEQNAESELAELMAEYCQLQVMVDKFDEHRERSAIIERAIEIDNRLSHWAMGQQITDQFSTVMVPEPSAAVLGDCWHRYGSMFMVSMINHYRTIRILLNALLITHIELLLEEPGALNYVDAPFSMSCREQVEASKALILELAYEFCASVPYFLGPTELNGDTSVQPRYRRAHGKLLLWPLMVVGQVPCVPETMKSWIISRLQGLSDTMHLHKAGILAKMLWTGVYSRKVWREEVPEETWKTDYSAEGR